jgi:hypothetical protein
VHWGNKEAEFEEQWLRHRVGELIRSGKTLVEAQAQALSELPPLPFWGSGFWGG